MCSPDSGKERVAACLRLGWLGVVQPAGLWQGLCGAEVTNGEPPPPDPPKCTGSFLMGPDEFAAPSSVSLKNDLKEPWRAFHNQRTGSCYQHQGSQGGCNFWGWGVCCEK